MTRTTCPTCKRPLTHVDISANLLTEVTATYGCEKHTHTATYQVPTRQRPADPDARLHRVGARITARGMTGTVVS